MRFTVLFTSRHILLNGALLPETLCVYHPIKYQHIPITNTLYLCIFKLQVPVIVILQLWIGSDTYNLILNFLMYLNFVFYILKMATWLAETCKMSP